MFSKETLEAIGVILAVIISFFAASIKDWLKELWDKRKANNEFSNKNLRNNISIDFNIRQMLARLMGVTECDRTNVFIWHNGSTDIAGIPFRKMTCQYECVREGITKEQQNLKALEISDYPEILPFILDSDNFFQVICVNKLNDCYLKGLLKRMGIFCLIVKSLKMKNRNYNYGFLSIGFTSKQCAGELCFNEELKNKFNKNIKDIALIIENELTQKK